MFEYITLQTTKAPQASMMHLQGFFGYRPARCADFLLRNPFNSAYYICTVVV